MSAPPADADPPPLFSERLRRRRELWWKGGGQGAHDREACRTPLPVDVDAGLEADDPAWHCCEHWQRKLSNKWNSRLFAAAHGVAVPRLYWHGRDVAALPFDELPGRYVVRPALGEAGRGVLVMSHGRELLRGLRLPRALMRRYLARVVGRIGNPDAELLVEEFVQDAEGGAGVPDSYKFHVFDGRVEFCCVQRRLRPAVWPVRKVAASREYYHRDWSLMDDPPVLDARPVAARPLPDGAPALLEAAERLGRAYGTYVRVDLFLSADGPVFGEFSPTSGLRDSFHARADRWLGDLWQRSLPDRV